MSVTTKDKQLGRARRHHRLRKKVSGSSARPRLAVFRSNKHIVAQVIDDRAGRTLAAASTHEADLRGGGTSNKEAATAVGRLVAERIELQAVTFSGVLDVAKPVVDEAKGSGAPRRRDAATAVVAAHHDVFDTQDVNSVLEHRQAVQVGVNHKVGHVAMDEELTRKEPDDLVGGNSAVGAADPQVARRLLVKQAVEEVRLELRHGCRPTTVVFEKMG